MNHLGLWGNNCLEVTCWFVSAPPADPSTQLAVSGISHCASSARDVPDNASVSSKCLQTEEEAQSEQVMSDDTLSS